MRKKAMTNNGPEDKGPGVILDLSKAPIVSLDDLKKSTEPRGVPGGAGRGKEPQSGLEAATTDFTFPVLFKD